MIGVSIANDTLGLLDHAAMVGGENAHERRENAWRFACRRFDVDGIIGQMPWPQQQRYHTFIHQGHAAWIVSRASGVALVSVCVADAEFRLKIQRDEIVRRDRMTIEVCMLVASALSESVWCHVERQSQALGYDYATSHLLSCQSYPGYVFVRNWLAHECDARYVLACEAAFRLTALHNRYRSGRTRENWEINCERGWL